jgi:hypothetical protein
MLVTHILLNRNLNAARYIYWREGSDSENKTSVRVALLAGLAAYSLLACLLCVLACLLACLLAGLLACWLACLRAMHMSLSWCILNLFYVYIKYLYISIPSI